MFTAETPLHQTPSSKPIELIFSERDGIKISMDVYIPSTATSEQKASIFLWWHGGGLLQGTRKAVAPHMLSAPERHNVCLISADYRLAPQSRMPDILTDAADALRFLRSQAFSDATGGRVDPSRVVVSGSSAGGWLSLLAGTGIGYEACGVEPPAAGAVSGIAAIYPITDLLDEFWTTPQRPVSYMDRIIQQEEVAPFLNPSADKLTSSPVDGRRAMFYHYMIQEAILADLLLEGTGIAPGQFSIAQNLKTGRYRPPPMYIITGNQDGKVAHRQSLDVVAAANEIGAQVEYHEIIADHSFDKEPIYRMDSLYAFFKKCTA